jgi:hypothetical protein
VESIHRDLGHSQKGLIGFVVLSSSPPTVSGRLRRVLAPTGLHPGGCHSSAHCCATLRRFCGEELLLRVGTSLSARGGERERVPPRNQGEIDRTTKPISPENLEATLRINRVNHAGGTYEIVRTHRSIDGKQWDRSSITQDIDGKTIERFLEMTLQILEGIAPF